MIGLVGGVGSGKSTLARLLSEKHPIQIVEGDSVGHQVLTEPEVKKSLRQIFGEVVFTAGGEIDRRQMSRLVFGSSPEQTTAREKLEQIVHPRIKSELTRQIELARATPGLEAIVLDAAVMLETGWRELCDAVVFVEVSFEQRLKRVFENRGWSREQLQQRELSQWPLDQKRQASTDMVDNSGDPQIAVKQLEQILQRTSKIVPR